MSTNKLVPTEPTKEQWSGLARDIVFWLYMDGSNRPTGEKLHKHLKRSGVPIPDWLAKEIPDVDYVPEKGTVAAVIYKAMVEAAPAGNPKGMASLINYLGDDRIKFQMVHRSLEGISLYKEGVKLSLVTSVDNISPTETIMGNYRKLGFLLWVDAELAREWEARK